MSKRAKHELFKCFFLFIITCFQNESMGFISQLNMFKLLKKIHLYKVLFPLTVQDFTFLDFNYKFKD